MIFNNSLHCFYFIVKGRGRGFAIGNSGGRLPVVILLQAPWDGSAMAIQADVCHRPPGGGLHSERRKKMRHPALFFSVKPL